MTLVGLLGRALQQPEVNFFLTNRIPRRLLTRFMGWFSRLEHPLVRDASIAAFRLFADDLNLEEARKTRFESLHDCFVRELKDGARPIDPDPAVLVSPCDALVVAGGRISGNQLIQAKGHSYTLEELLVDPGRARAYVDGRYVALRLKANMYHRFHAPCDGRVEEVRYVPGDVWNVNPAALARVPRLYARNERAVLHARVGAHGRVVSLVPVAAVLVASLRLHFLDLRLHQGHRGPRVIACDAPLRKGEEIGWFEQGSTMIVLAPEGIELCDNVRAQALIRVGQPLMRLT